MSYWYCYAQVWFAVVLLLCCFPSFGIFSVDRKTSSLLKKYASVSILVSRWFSLISSCERMSVSYFWSCSSGSEGPRQKPVKIYFNSHLCCSSKDCWVLCLGTKLVETYSRCFCACTSSYNLHICYILVTAHSFVSSWTQHRHVLTQ